MFTVSCLCTLIFQCVPPEVTFMLPRPAAARCFDNSTFTKIGTFNGCECAPLGRLTGARETPLLTIPSSPSH